MKGQAFPPEEEPPISARRRSEGEREIDKKLAESIKKQKGLTNVLTLVKKERIVIGTFREKNRERGDGRLRAAGRRLTALWS